MKKIILASIAYLLFNSITFSQFVPVWASLTNPPSQVIAKNSICVDASGNTYVLGVDNFLDHSYIHNNILLKKFDQSGIAVWTHTISGINPDTVAVPTGILLDNSNNVVMYGYFFGLQLYTYLSTAFMYKFNSSGNELFHVEIARPGVDLQIKKILKDNSDNYYMFGKSKDTSMFSDSVFVIKYNSSGVAQWTRNCSIAYFLLIEQNGINFDNAGNLLVVTQSRISSSACDVKIIKYSPSGTLLWQQNYSNGNFNVGSDIASDASGNVYVSCGISNYYVDSVKPSVIKYSTAGVFQWIRTNYSFTYTKQVAKEIVPVSDGVLLHAVTDSARIFKYDFNGNLLWQKTINGRNTMLSSDNSGGAYLAALVPGLYNVNQNLFRINTSGAFLNLINYNHTGSSRDSNLSFVNLPSGNIHMAANSDSSMLIVKFIPAVVHSATITNNNIGKSINDLQLTYDTININPTELPAGAYVTNVTMSIDSVLHPTGLQLEFSLIHEIVTDTIIYRRGAGANFIGTNLNDAAFLNPICNTNLSPFTGVYQPCKPLSQFSSRPVEGPWILRIYDRFAGGTGTLKAWSLNVTYSIPIGVQQISTGIPNSFSLQQNYPNPFNPETKIAFNIPLSRGVPEGRGVYTQIKIYDALGREIETLVNENLKPGTYEVSWNASAYPSGVYFYKLTSGDYSEAKKMVLVK